MLTYFEIDTLRKVVGETQDTRKLVISNWQNIIHL